jgi:hypothetical protein
MAAAARLRLDADGFRSAGDHVAQAGICRPVRRQAAL